MAEEERKQLAAEVIRFMNERVPKERRKRVGWAVVLVDLDDDVGPLSAFDEPDHTAEFLIRAGNRARGGEHQLLKAAPRSS